ncbi:MAG: nucleoside hydrolase [Paracoccaceae bacterium]
MPTPVIIDTDPGIDDAVAIFCALAAPSLRVLGLTTVAGNIGLETTTANAGRILSLAGVDVPVIRGAAGPLARAGFAATDVHGNDGLGGVAMPDPVAAPRDGAVDWMADTLTSHPEGAVDLFTLGPLTNLAGLLERRPEAARRLRRVIAMGGAVDERGNVSPRAEFNFAADPEAAERVLAAGLPLTLVPLDVTRRVRARPADTATLRAGPRPEARAAGALIDAYFLTTQGGDSRPLHDPCVVLLAEAPQLFRCETRVLGVDTSGGPDAGALGPGPHPVTVAMGVDGAAALDLLMRRLMGQ